MNNKKNEKKIADLLKVLGSSFRIRLLYALGDGEACVCHLETVLHTRQAHISQHLMVLRDAGLLNTRRDGKYVFYSVKDPTIFDLIEQVAKLVLEGDEGVSFRAGQVKKVPGCPCPHCAEN